MREIKFAWVCRNLHFNKIERVELTDTMLINHSYPSWIKSNNCEVITKILPIGRNDKNGKEIYEGDKLQFAAEDEDNIWIEVVKWSKEMLSWCLYDDKDDSEPLELLSDQAGADFEVIGNIYIPEQNDIKRGKRNDG